MRVLVASDTVGALDSAAAGQVLGTAWVERGADVAVVPAGEAGAGFLDAAAATPPTRMTQHYVEIFDTRRRCCLYLTWWTDGETRRRGSALAALKARYRTAGLELDTSELPDFLPGLGQLFVDPATLPAGPFLAYDHDGRLVSTVYMIPLTDLNPDKRFDDLAAPGGVVDHVDIYFNAGHPGVETPHAHLVLWHVSYADEARVAE